MTSTISLFLLISGLPYKGENTTSITTLLVYLSFAQNRLIYCCFQYINLIIIYPVPFQILRYNSDNLYPWRNECSIFINLLKSKPRAKH